MCRHSFRLKPNSRGPLTCIRLYDRLPRPETGSLLTVTPPVMNGPPSPAAWIGIGSVRMSTASPVTTLRFPGGVGDAHRLDRVGRVERAAHDLVTTWPLSQPSASAARVLVGDRGREDRPRRDRSAAPVGSRPRARTAAPGRSAAPAWRPRRPARGRATPAARCAPVARRLPARPDRSVNRRILGHHFPLRPSSSVLRPSLTAPQTPRSPRR